MISRSPFLCALLPLAFVASGCDASRKEDVAVVVTPTGVTVGAPAGSVMVIAVGGSAVVDVGAVGPGSVASGKNQVVHGGNQACPAGGNCSWDCPAGGCAQSCAAGTNCTASCAGGSCKQSCAADANCTFSCAGGKCSQTCKGITCTKTCAGAGCT